MRTTGSREVGPPLGILRSEAEGDCSCDEDELELARPARLVSASGSTAWRSVGLRGRAAASSIEGQ